MKVVISINSSFKNYVFNDEKKLPICYFTAINLIPAFQKRGHDIVLVHPEDVSPMNEVPFEKLYEFKNNFFKEVDPTNYVNPDLFYVMELGENLNSVESKKFVKGLNELENKVKLMLNSARATQYELKDVQKTLDAPFIPSYDIKTNEDLISAVQKSEKGIIAKPIIGLQGYGVTYITQKNVYEFTKKQNISDYVYEQYISANYELRVLFIDSKILFARKKFVDGKPANDSVMGYEFVNLSKYHKDITNSIIKSTGMFAGSVDFRDKYVQEINGSGIGLVVKKRENGVVKKDEILYDLTNFMVEKMEEKFKR